MSRTFLTGGATEGEPAVVIRIKNLPEVIAKQGGAAGSAAYAVAPKAVTEKAFSTIQEQLTTEFKKQGVDAQVTVTTSPPTGSAPAGKRDFLTGMVVGGATLVGGYYFYRLIVVKYLIPLFTRSAS